MKHTPGPWEVHQFNHIGGELWLSIGHEGRGPITELCGEAVKEVSPVARMKYLITPDEEQWANARLIAAAPDLLEALEFYATGDDGGAVARVAIAKVKGPG